MNPRFAIDGFSAGYAGRAVVHDIDLEVERGEVVCLLGPNGAGKSTTLATVAGLLPSLAGSVRVDGEVIDTRRPERVARGGIALVPEDRSLFPSLTVREHFRLRRGSRNSASKVVGWFPALADLMDRRVGVLSGGEQQMVAVGRALVAEPRVLMIDELSLGLAPIIVRSLFETVRQIASESGCAVLVVEQHVELALGMADRGYVLDRGRVVAEGRATDLAAQSDLLAATYLGG